MRASHSKAKRLRLKLVARPLLIRVDLLHIFGHVGTFPPPWKRSEVYL